MKRERVSSGAVEGHGSPEENDALCSVCMSVWFDCCQCKSSLYKSVCVHVPHLFSLCASAELLCCSNGCVAPQVAEGHGVSLGPDALWTH